ncbi:plasmid recombination protein [Spiroplasma endosymbiont of Polydrusus formosus]|uniref:plasmid recombination protein n=1 Tax=Spiroplasma endosymbiont of Polydrusus formosus TaxID=3139326 RepID=UPI0035B52AE8
MKNNLKTDIGYLYSAVHIDETTPHIHFGFIPISKVFSKKLNEERYIINNNQIFGGKKQLQKLNNYHDNYLTKADYEIEHGKSGVKVVIILLIFGKLKNLNEIS